jgi:hypothetical protein
VSETAEGRLPPSGPLSISTSQSAAPPEYRFVIRSLTIFLFGCGNWAEPPECSGMALALPAPQPNRQIATGGAELIRIAAKRHRQLNWLRQIPPSWTVSSEASGDAGYLGPDPEGSGAGLAVISSIRVGRTAEEVGHLIVNREEALGRTG